MQIILKVVRISDETEYCFLSKVSVSKKVLDASYLIAEIITQKRKSHTVGETLGASGGVMVSKLD